MRLRYCESYPTRTCRAIVSSHPHYHYLIVYNITDNEAELTPTGDIITAITQATRQIVSFCGHRWTEKRICNATRVWCMSIWRRSLIEMPSTYTPNHCASLVYSRAGWTRNAVCLHNICFLFCQCVLEPITKTQRKWGCNIAFVYQTTGTIPTARDVLRT